MNEQLKSPNQTDGATTGKKAAHPWIWPLVIAAVVMFLLSFHIVSGSNGIMLIPKDHLSFSETFISVDAIISAYNDRDLAQRIRGDGVNMHLVNKLKEKGLIEYDSPNSSGGSSSDHRDQFTLNKYYEIQNGMSYSEVVRILGDRGQELSRSEIGGYTSSMYQWINPSGSSLTVMFSNDLVASKAQLGLQ
jgi:hypothetical protein